MGFILLFISGKVFAIIIGFYYYRHLSTPFKIALAQTIIATFAEIYGYYTGTIKHEFNNWFFNPYALLEVWLVGIVATFLITNRKIRSLFVSLIIIYTIVWIINISIRSIYEWASYATICGYAFLTIMYVIVLVDKSTFVSQNIIKQPVFWLALSSLLYFACDIPYMGMNNFVYFHMSRAVSENFAIINQALDIIRYPMVGISFILLGRQNTRAKLKAA